MPSKEGPGSSKTILGALAAVEQESYFCGAQFVQGRFDIRQEQDLLHIALVEHVQQGLVVHKGSNGKEFSLLQWRRNCSGRSGHAHGRYTLFCCFFNFFYIIYNYNII